MEFTDGNLYCLLAEHKLRYYDDHVDHAHELVSSRIELEHSQEKKVHLHFLHRIQCCRQANKHDSGIGEEKLSLGQNRTY